MWEITHVWQNIGHLILVPSHPRYFVVKQIMRYPNLSAQLNVPSHQDWFTTCVEA